MKNSFFLFLSLIFAISQGPFLPVVLAEGLLVVMLIYANTDSNRMRISTNSWVSLFVSGLVFDLVQGKTLGTTSLIFGVGALVLSLRSPWVFSLVALALGLARSRLVFGEFLWVPSAIGAFLTILLFRVFWRSTDVAGVKLR